MSAVKVLLAGVVLGGFEAHSRKVAADNKKNGPFDLLLCLGSDLLRMSVYSAVDPLPAGMPVMHISERDWEIGKNHPTEFAVQANVRETLRALLPLVRGGRPPRRARRSS